MRFNFWRQTLDSIYEGRPPNSPVATELYSAVVKHRLSKSWLKRMISARVREQFFPSYISSPRQNLCLSVPKMLSALKCSTWCADVNVVLSFPEFGIRKELNAGMIYGYLWES